jgi:hypothetical protein
METTQQQPEAKSPLPLPVLLTYFFSRIHFEINPKWTATSDGEHGNLSSALSLGRPKDTNRRQLAVRVILEAAEGKTAPYKADIEAVAVFEHGVKDRAVEEIDRHIILAGAPLLYGAIREQLLMLSARTHLPRLMLPLQFTRDLLANSKVNDLED